MSSNCKQNCPVKLILAFLAIFSIWPLILAVADDFPPKYHTYTEGISELRVLEQSYPEICRLDSIGISSRDSVVIYSLKISDNVGFDEDEAAIFLCGGAHADEILGPEIVLSFCQDIVSRYAQGDTAALQFVNNLEILAIPFTNPEGHIIVEEGDLDWRKNKTDNNGDGIFDFHDGVDGNRNYDFAWELDNTPGGLTPESLMYKGPFPFSESESRAIAQLGQKYKPVIAVDYHSPTYGYAEVVYFCWFWSQYNRFSPDFPAMQNIGAGFASSLIKDDGVHSYALGVGLVNKGDFKTYFYGNFGTAAMSCEVSDTTIQDTALVDSICQRHLTGINYLLGRACRARLSGIVTDSLTGQPLIAEVKVLEAYGAEINPRYTRNSGRYDRLMLPGNYTLSIGKDGYATKIVPNVIVNDSSITTTDIQLLPALGAPILTYPPDNAIINDSISLNFSWSPCSTATNYRIDIGLDSSLQVLFESDSGFSETQYRNHILFPAGRYFWRATALNDYAPPAISDLRSFYINVAPSTPILIYPGNGASLDSTDRLIWLASLDPDSSDKPVYQLQISGDTLYTLLSVDVHISLQDSILSDTVKIMIQALEGHSNLAIDTKYFWRVMALDGYGVSSDWTVGSNWFIFMAQNHAPNAPDSGFSPANGEEVNSLWPLFTWSNASDPDPDDSTESLFYIIHIAIFPDFAGFVYTDTTGIGQNQILPLAAMTDNMHYYYHIKTLDDGGLSSDWSEVQDFWINHYNSPPEPFPLLGPLAGTKQANYYTIFTWGNTFDYDPMSIITYSVQLSQDSAFNLITWSHATLTDTTITIATDSLNAIGQAYWRVLAIDDESLVRVGGIPEGIRPLMILPPGDANTNGVTNGVDVTFLVNYFKGYGSVPDPLLAGDANGNCQTNGIDVTYLVNYLKGVGNAPMRGNCEQVLSSNGGTYSK